MRQGRRRVAIVVEPRLGRIYRLRESHVHIWFLCDGTRTIAQIAAQVGARGGSNDTRLIANVVRRLARAGLLGGFGEEADVRTLDNAGRLGRLRTILTAKIEWLGVDPLAQRLYHAAGYLIFTRTALALIVAIQGVGLILFGMRASELPALVPHVGVVIWGVLPLLLVSAVMHEAAHVITVKHFGRRVIGVSVGWSWMGPFLGVDTSAMWLADQRQRIAVSSAGPLSDLFMAGLFAVIAACGDGFLSAVGLAASLLLYVIFVFNALPIPGHDGHHVLAELFGHPLAPDRTEQGRNGERHVRRPSFRRR